MAPKATTIERRFVPLSAPAELREEGDVRRFVGLANPYGDRADLGRFTEEFAEGAFAKTARESDVRFLLNHNPDSVMARTSAGNLTLEDRSEGLRTEATPPADDFDWQRLQPKLREGLITQMSIGFVVQRGKESWDDSGDKPHRIIHEARLFDVSAVTFPAYEGTDANLRDAVNAALATYTPTASTRWTEAVAALVADLPSDPEEIRTVLATLEEHLQTLEPEPEPEPDADTRDEETTPDVPPLWVEGALHRLALRKRKAAA